MLRIIEEKRRGKRLEYNGKYAGYIYPNGVAILSPRIKILKGEPCHWDKETNSWPVYKELMQQDLLYISFREVSENCWYILKLNSDGLVPMRSKKNDDILLIKDYNWLKEKVNGKNKKV